VVKLNERKIRYKVREKIKNRSNKRIAAEMKVSVSTVKRVLRHYLRTGELISIKKFGRPRKEIEPELEDLMYLLNMVSVLELLIK
jgi:transposase